MTQINLEIVLKIRSNLCQPGLAGLAQQKSGQQKVKVRRCY